VMLLSRGVTGSAPPCQPSFWRKAHPPLAKTVERSTSSEKCVRLTVKRLERTIKTDCPFFFWRQWARTHNVTCFGDPNTGQAHNRREDQD
jgi:hypothetical protein